MSDREADEAPRSHFDQRAAGYDAARGSAQRADGCDDWCRGTGTFAGRERPGCPGGTLEVELAGVEPATSWVRSKRSAN